MPTPIGHVLGGVAAGWLVAGRSTAAPREVRARTSWWAHAREPHAALFGATGAAPDIDLLFGTHSTYTHSVGAVAGTAVAVLRELVILTPIVALSGAGRGRPGGMP